MEPPRPDFPPEESAEPSFLERVRLHELELATGWMPSGARVLELGAGSGWQTRRLAQRGFEVAAIDVPSSNYKAVRVWPVLDYDGKAIPFGDGSFDVVFSSNVLEHIAHVEEFQSEIHRVLRPGGIALHIVPSATWRLWTNVAHYPFAVKCVLKLALGAPDRGAVRDAEPKRSGRSPSLCGRCCRHGTARRGRQCIR